MKNYSSRPQSHLFLRVRYHVNGRRRHRGRESEEISRRIINNNNNGRAAMKNDDRRQCVVVVMVRSTIFESWASAHTICILARGENFK